MCFWIFKRKQKKAEEKTLKKPVEPKKETVAAKSAPKEEKPLVKDIYHISLNRDEKSPNYKKWRVRKQGSQKTIKYFDTQKEAIEFAQDLASKVDGSIVIHKMDGTIRKQNY